MAKVVTRAKTGRVTPRVGVPAKPLRSGGGTHSRRNPYPPEPDPYLLDDLGNRRLDLIHDPSGGD